MKMKRRVPIVIALVGLLILAAFTIPQITFLCTPAGQTRSISNIRQIVFGLLIYANDHDNKMPATLFELIPEYIESAEIFYIKPHPYLKVAPYYPDNKNSRKLLVDALSPYHFIHYPEARLIVIHETPGLWTPNTVIASFLTQDIKGNWQGGSTAKYKLLDFELRLMAKLENRPYSPTVK